MVALIRVTNTWLTISFAILLTVTSAAAAGENEPATLQSTLDTRDAFECRSRPTVRCLTDVAISAARYAPMPYQIARSLAGAGRFAEAYAATTGGPGQFAEQAEIAVLEIEQHARAKPDTAADLSPIEQALTATENRSSEMDTYLVMAGAELAGYGYRAYEFDSAMIEHGHPAWNSQPIPMPTIRAISDRISVPLKPLRTAEFETQATAEARARSIIQAKALSPVASIYLLAEAGLGMEVMALNDGRINPQPDPLLDAIEAMHAYQVDTAKLLPVLARAVDLSMPRRAADEHPLTQSNLRRTIRLAQRTAGHSAAEHLLDIAIEKLPSMASTYRRLAWVELAAAALDIGDRPRAEQIVSDMGSSSDPASARRQAVLLYRLDRHVEFAEVLARVRENSRPDVWTGILREADVTPTDDLVSRSLAGLDFLPRLNQLVAIGLSMITAGQADRIPPIVSEIVSLQEQMLRERSYDMRNEEFLAAAARIAWQAGDAPGAGIALRAMINAAFDSGTSAPANIAKAASFWHRRMPQAQPAAY